MIAPGTSSQVNFAQDPQTVCQAAPVISVNADREVVLSGIIDPGGVEGLDASTRLRAGDFVRLWG